MWRIALPGLGNLFMILMKDTALVSVIGLEEIMRHSQIGVTVTKEPSPSTWSQPASTWA